MTTSPTYWDKDLPLGCCRTPVSAPAVRLPVVNITYTTTSPVKSDLGKLLVNAAQ